MTERGLPLADGASACPFVAFEDNRDERASVPDHRHRCYAEARPAPRALAHQQAYCLSSAFPVCPTFQDWARREAARARDAADAAAAAKGAEPTAAAHGGGAAAAAGPSGAVGLAASGAAGLAAGEAFAGPDAGDDDSGPDQGASAADPARPTASDDAAGDADTGDADPGDADEFGARRNPPRDWAAPPPWLASDERGGAGTAGTPPFLSHRTPEPGQGLAGSAADWLAGGPAPASAPGVAAGSSAAGLAGPPARGRPDSSDPLGAADDQVTGDHERDDDLPRRPARRARAYEQHLGGTDGPDWERPRRYEAYPSIRTRVALPNMSRLAVMAGAIAIAAIALFFLPAILGIGSGSGPAASTSPSSVAASASLLPTDVPAPTPVLYTIKKNDILSRVASAHGVTLAELLAANPTIKNPNKITEGQQIIIPVPSQASDQVGGSGGASASP